MHVPFSLLNARLVLPREVRAGGLIVHQGTIHEAGDVAAAGPAIDCGGDLLMPGLIELHTDNLERHLKPRPGTTWPAARAILSHDAELAAAGITTAWDAISLGNDLGDGDSSGTSREEIAAIVSARDEGLLRIDHRLHFRCELSSPQLSAHLAEAVNVGRPELVSLMDHTPGQGQWTDVERFRRHYAGRYDLDPKQLDALIERRQGNRAEFAATNRAAAITLARRFDCLISSHDDTGLPSVRQARADGCALAEFPTSIEAARHAKEHGMRVVAGAPNLVRGGSHSGNVAVADLIGAGHCDILSSDYYPPSLLQAVFLLSRKFGIPLYEAVALVTSAPARAMHLSDRGCIDVGQRADLIRVRETDRGPVVIAAWCAGRQVG